MTPILATVAAAGLLSSVSQAHELSLETGAYNAPDEGYRIFNDHGAVQTQGVRAAFDLSEHWSVVGSWATANEGQSVETDEAVPLFVAAFRHHRFASGPRFSWAVAPWFVPYASVQAVFWTGTARLDDNPDVEDNPGQYTFRGFSVGGQAMLGAFVEPITIGKGEDAPRLGIYGELGYGYNSRMSFTDPENRDLATKEAVSLGDLQFHGLVGNAGVSFRF